MFGLGRLLPLLVQLDQRVQNFLPPRLLPRRQRCQRLARNRLGFLVALHLRQQYDVVVLVLDQPHVAGGVEGFGGFDDLRAQRARFFQAVVPPQDVGLSIERLERFVRLRRTRGWVRRRDRRGGRL